MYDVLIRGGKVVDGQGGPARMADVAVEGELIAAVGFDLPGDAREVIDARGLIVTPGFVDVHTHYDGQVTWDEQLLPSSAHGVTTAVIGACGIGFAPVRRGTEGWLISLMEGVEDIPGTVLHEGIKWSWQSFPEYLDFLASRRFAFDIAAQVPHSAARAYVMGARAADDEPATEEDLTELARIVREGIEAGAVGVGTSRIAMHQASDGRVVPGTTASEVELMTIAEAIGQAGGGVFQLVPSGAGGNQANTLSSTGARTDRKSLLEEIEMMRRISRRSGQKLTFSFSENGGLGKEAFAQAMDLIHESFAADEGLYPQFSARPTGILSSLDALHAFQARPTYRALAHLPLRERVARMRDPDVKRMILTEADIPATSTTTQDNFHLILQKSLPVTVELSDPPDYEPDLAHSIEARARAEGRDPQDLLYDTLLKDDGSAVLMSLASNYLDGDLRVTEQLLRDPRVIVGLGDGGAHVRLISDASLTTFLLAHWSRDRTRGGRLALEQLVKKQTWDTASLYGFTDRGAIAPGLRADLNVIDYERLRLRRPFLTADLPAGGVRFLQNAEGYAATLVGGVVTRRNDQDTGERPGRLVRRRSGA